MALKCERCRKIKILRGSKNFAHIQSLLIYSRVQKINILNKYFTLDYTVHALASQWKNDSER